MGNPLLNDPSDIVATGTVSVLAGVGFLFSVICSVCSVSSWVSSDLFVCIFSRSSPALQITFSGVY